MAEDNDKEIFSEDPDEQLNIENEILKLKLQVELGGNYESEGDLPPEIENAFLKNVIDFEHKYANASSRTLYDVLEKPAFIKAELLSDAQIDNALADLETLMEKKGIVVDYGEEYGTRLKYTFITEELLQKESHYFHVPGMTMHYVYEEFHPNHRLDISNQADCFYDDWIEQNFNENSSEMAATFTTPPGIELTRDELFARFKNIFDSYTSFENDAFSIDAIHYELNDEGVGKGTAEGFISYNAILENGEAQHFNGSYKLFFKYDGYWEINYFEWPGFIW